MVNEKPSYFRLLDLPVELVVHIIDFAVTNSSKDKPIQIKPDNKDQLSQPAITQTCRLLRREGVPKFYANNIFLGDSTDKGARLLWDWLAMIGPEYWGSVEELWVQWSVGQEYFGCPERREDMGWENFEQEFAFHTRRMGSNAALRPQATIRKSEGKILLKRLFGNLCYELSLKNRRMPAEDWESLQNSEFSFPTDKENWYSMFPSESQAGK